LTRVLGWTKREPAGNPEGIQLPLILAQGFGDAKSPTDPPDLDLAAAVEYTRRIREFSVNTSNRRPRKGRMRREHDYETRCPEAQGERWAS